MGFLSVLSFIKGGQAIDIYYEFIILGIKKEKFTYIGFAITYQ